jgi:hypothetical protein
MLYGGASSVSLAVEAVGDVLEQAGEPAAHGVVSSNNRLVKLRRRGGE